MTPCWHSHTTSSGVLWPVRLSHTSTSRSGGRSCGKVKGIVRPACHIVHAACVVAGSSDAFGAGSAARIALKRSRSLSARHVAEFLLLFVVSAGLPHHAIREDAASPSRTRDPPQETLTALRTA